MLKIDLKLPRTVSLKMWRLLGIGRRQQPAGAADDTTTVDEAELERSGSHIFRGATAADRFPLTDYQLSGAAFTVLVQPDDDIAHLKSLIAKADTSLDAKRQHLYVSETESELQRGALSSNGISHPPVPEVVYQYQQVNICGHG